MPKKVMFKSTSVDVTIDEKPTKKKVKVHEKKPQQDADDVDEPVIEPSAVDAKGSKVIDDAVDEKEPEVVVVDEKEPEQVPEVVERKPDVVDVDEPVVEKESEVADVDEPVVEKEPVEPEQTDAADEKEPEVASVDEPVDEKEPVEPGQTDAADEKEPEVADVDEPVVGPSVVDEKEPVEQEPGVVDVVEKGPEVVDVTEVNVSNDTLEVHAKPKVIQLEQTIKLFVVENLVDDEMCDTLKRIVTKNMVDSTITAHIEDFRKSKTSVLDINEPLIHIVNKKICDIIGADIVNGEPIQGIHYENGGYFKPHTDYFETTETMLCGKSGNREMTAILYLDNLEKSHEGELVFPILTKRIKPKKGMLVYWNNMRGGVPLYTSLNEDRPVAGTSKTCFVKYIRERPFF